LKIIVTIFVPGQEGDVTKQILIWDEVVGIIKPCKGMFLCGTPTGWWLKRAFGRQPGRL